MSQCLFVHSSFNNQLLKTFYHCKCKLDVGTHTKTHIGGSKTTN